eukprot:4905304-Alexandrium_andersonii.AAC.1
MCAKLNRSLYGARAAPARWEALYTTALQGLGFVHGKASARCFYHPGRDIRRVVRGDEFTFTGYDPDLGWAEKVMTESFLCKVEGRLGGDSGDLKEVRLLDRISRWAPSGLKYEADPRHAEQLARDLLQ